MTILTAAPPHPGTQPRGNVDDPQYNGVIRDLDDVVAGVGRGAAIGVEDVE